MYPEDLFRRRLLYLSPHYDDMVYANGALMCFLKANGTDITNLNFFTESCWTSSEVHQKSRRTISNLRREEEAKVCKRMGIRTASLNLEDSSVRGLDGQEELLQRLSSAELYQIKRAFLKAISGSCYDYVLTPLGLGGHVDHVAVYHIIQSIGQPVLYYEDMPYTTQIKDVLTAVKERNESLKPLMFRLDAFQSSKHEYMLQYQSQTEENNIVSIMKYGVSLCDSGFWERIWY